MKKRILVPVGLITCILLSGCVSDAKYEDLERRVAYLEDQLGVKAPSENDNSEEDEVESSSSGVDQPETTTSTYSYYIDDLSDAELVEECKYYFSNLPHQGESYDEYLKTVKATPVNIYKDYGVEMQFYNNSVSHEPTERDVITRIAIAGSQTEMDGTIGYSGNSYGVTISMIIKDYNKAASVYASLYDIIVDENYKDISDNRDSTRWNAMAMYWSTDSSGYGVTFMEMSKEDNGYNLTATYYRRR